MIEKVLDRWYVMLVSATAILFLFYHQVLWHLNSYVFAPNGDGIKNYYTYMFQAKYGESFWDFKGMNYPFYEHIVFTDAHPLLAWIVGRLGLADYGVGILNGLMIFSFPIAAVIIQRILNHYQVSSVWAFFSALSICFLSPQIFRLTGHLSLSYVFAIPLMWYLILKTQQTSQMVWPIFIFITLFVFFFTHPYLGLILAVFGLFYALVFWFFDKRTWKALLLKIAVPIFAAIGIFQALVLFTDSHTDRMKNPSGFFDMYAKWNSLLVPHHGPMNKVKHALSWRMSTWETWTYLGLFVIITMLFIIGYYFKNRRSIDLKSVVNTPIGKMYIVGHLVLLFSFCFPLKYDFLRWIVEVLGPLQQFRVLGRFAWVYFYVASILAIVVLNQIMLKSEKKRAFHIFFTLGILFSVFEFAPAHIGVAKAISKEKNPFIFENLKEDEKDIVSWTKQQNYDAVLFLPFTHLSSENIFIAGSEKANYHSFILSYHAQLPLLNTVSSRTSVTEAIAFHNLFSPEFIEKTFQNNLPKNANIMLVKDRSLLNDNELRMTYSSEGIYENDEFNVYAFSFDNWNNPLYFNHVLALNRKAKQPIGAGWKADTNHITFVYESFDEIAERNSFSGPGALAGQKDGFHVLKKDIVLPVGRYVASFWYNFRIDRADQEAVVEQKFKSGRGEWVAKNDIRQSNHIIGEWLFVEIPFEVSDSVESSTIILSGNRSKKWFIVDELLIRKEGESPVFKDEIRAGEPYLIYNNYRLRKSSFSE
ncbi:MAG: hypothetical protein R3279_02065 [Putridiphycobacter sp.]|nr:hypothetical protein [Putridiphycobacter sp.]